MDLCDYGTVKRLLASHGFTFSKSLGQNFLVNSEVCPAMSAALGADKSTGVIEIGPGIGTLTKELCKTAGKVVSIELDKRLFPLLGETLGEFGNFELVEGDALSLDLNSLAKEKFSDMRCVKVCANLPYYITSPIIMKMLESKLKAESMVLMVQKEAAERLCAETGSRNAGAVTVAANYYAETEILFEVSKECFMPPPKVDSAVIKLTPREKPPVEVKDEKRFFEIVKAAFAQRRKTALNSLSCGLGLPKERISAALGLIGETDGARAENFTVEQFAALSDIL